MSEKKEPQAGEFWRAPNGLRVEIVTIRQNGYVVFQTDDGRYNDEALTEVSENWWQDNQPEPEPEWFDLTPHGGHVLRQCDQFWHSLDSCWDVPHRVSEGATVKELKRIGYTQFRCLLKNAPPDLRPITGPPGLSMADIVGELRRDLPQIPKPKPATQTIVFHEVIRTVVDDFGNTEWQLQWSTNPVKDDVKTGRTETREVVR